MYQRGKYSTIIVVKQTCYPNMVEGKVQTISCGGRLY